MTEYTPPPLLEPNVKIEPERPIKQFFNDTISCLTEPKRFFTERYPQFSLTQALVFCVILNWLASLLEWVTRVVRHKTLLDGLLEIRDQLDSIPMWKGISAHFITDETVSTVPAWIVELISVSINPFKTLLAVLFSSLFVWVGGLILIPKKDDQDPIDYANFIKLIAISTAAPKVVGAILGFLPLSLGAFIGGIYLLYIEIYSIAIRYKISGLRAIAVVFLPHFVAILVGGCVVGLLLAVIFGTLGSFFH